MKAGVVLRGSIPEEQSLEMQVERQMGCMTGFLQIFDRHQILAGRRGVYPARRLPSSPSPAPSCTSPSERSDDSVSSSSKEIPSPPLSQAQSTQLEMRPPSPEPLGLRDAPARPSLPLPVFDFKEARRSSSWKFREAPRLSLDSCVDERGKIYTREIRTTPVRRQDDSDASDSQDQQRRSPSVVARLMGLEALPGSGGDDRGGGAEAEPYKMAELRRSASESRASRELLRYQFVDGGHFQPPPPRANLITADKHREVRQSIVRDTKPEPPLPSRVTPPACPPSHPQTAFYALQKKSFFDVQDYFVSELPKRVGGVSLTSEIEKRLRMRGIDEPAKDLETLKQMLEVIQLKGLLHSRQQQHRTGRPEPPHQPYGRNFVYEHSLIPVSCYDSPIVVMQPAPRSPSPRSPPPSLYSRSNASPPPPRRNQLASLEAASRFGRRNDAEVAPSHSRGNNGLRARGAGTPDPIQASSSASPVRRRSAPVPQAATTRGRLSADRRTSCPQSPKTGSPRKHGSDPLTRSPRSNSKPSAITATRQRSPQRLEDDFAASDSSVSTCSQFDFERVKSEYRDGRILLERCDKLLHSIAEITSKAAGPDDEDEHVNPAEQQPSPVSVLDATASFDRDDAIASPSPLPSKRSIHFKDQSQSTEGVGVGPWTPSISSVNSNAEGESEIDDSDFSYVSEILRSCDPHQTARLELQQQPWAAAAAAADDDTKGFPIHRRLVFDAVSEIVERRNQLSPWEAFLQSRSPVAGGKGRLLPGEVWAELRMIQEPVPADDLCEIICGVLRKDMAATAAERAWSDRPVEMSDAVLDIERLIFKDLVAETIRQFAFLWERKRCCGGPPLPPTAATGVTPPRRRLMF